MEHDVTRGRTEGASHAGGTSSGASDVKEFEIGEGWFVEADTAHAPRDALGQRVHLPDRTWPGHEHTNPHKDKTWCTIVAFSSQLGKYILDSHDGNHYAMGWDQFSQHLTQASKRKAAPPPQRAAPRGRRSTRRTN